MIAARKRSRPISDEIRCKPYPLYGEFIRGNERVEKFSNIEKRRSGTRMYIYIRCIFNIRYCFVLAAIERPKADPARNELQLTRILYGEGNLIEKVSAYSTREVEG